MLKQKPLNKKRIVLGTVLGVSALALATWITINGTEILRKFGANAYVPAPVVFSLYSAVTPSTDMTKNAANFYKLEEMYPIAYAKSKVDVKTYQEIVLDNNWNYAGVTTNSKFQRALVAVYKRAATAKYGFMPRYCTSAENWTSCYGILSGDLPQVHRFNDSKINETNAYVEEMAGMSDPYGYFMAYSNLGNNPANCTKAYLKTQSASMIKAEGSADLEKYWWPKIQLVDLYTPKQAGKYFMSEPACFVSAKGTAQQKSFANIVDTRYDTTQDPNSYAFQTGNVVIAVINLPAPAKSVIERMYFTDNSASSSNFSSKYCTIKGSSDPIHCTKSLSGSYRGIDVMKNGRLYNLFAFEQLAFTKIKNNTASNKDKYPVIGGVYAYSWWRQTVGTLPTSFWDADGNSFGNSIGRDIPAQGTDWNVNLLK